MLTMRPQEYSETADPAEVDQALALGKAVALAFEKGGGKLSAISRDALASDLAGILEPLLETCTNAEWIEAINARLDRLEGEADTPGPRLERFGPNGIAEMTTPLQ
jgi:hypothetical protein